MIVVFEDKKVGDFDVDDDVLVFLLFRGKEFWLDLVEIWLF